MPASALPVLPLALNVASPPPWGAPRECARPAAAKALVLLQDQLPQRRRVRLALGEQASRPEAGERPRAARRRGQPRGVSIAALATEAALLGGAWAWWRRAPAPAPRGEGEEAGAAEGRCHLYDTTKAVAIVLVVLGHWCFYVEHFWTDELSRWLNQGSRGVSMLSSFSCNFSMGLFCAVSGACSQGPPTARRLRNYVQFLVVPAVMWIGVFHTVLGSLLTNKAVADWSPSALVSSEWYLSSLILWRAAGFLFLHRMHPMAVVLLAQAAASAGGYLSFGGLFGSRAWYWQFLQGDATLGFFPYFALGYALPLPSLLRAVPQPHWLVRLAVALSVLLWAVYVAPQLGVTGDPHFSYWDTDETPDDFLPVGRWLFWTHRLARFGADCFPAMAFLVLVLPRGETFCTWMGPHTLSPYLFHHAFLDWRNAALKHIAEPVVTSTAGHAAVLAFNVLLVYLGVALFCSPCWRQAVGWLLAPKWLSPVADGLQAWATRKEKEPSLRAGASWGGS